MGEVSESGGDLIHPCLPCIPLNHASQEGYSSQGNGAHSPGVCVALQLLFDVPEEVVLGQEKGGTQSQELPALPGDTGSVE